MAKAKPSVTELTKKFKKPGVSVKQAKARAKFVKVHGK